MNLYRTHVTLCAGFLLAGGAIQAQTGLVKVTDPSLLLDGGTYILGTAEGDSAVCFNAVDGYSYETVNTAKYSSRNIAKSKVTFVKDGNNWSLEYNGKNIYAWTGDIFYTNFPTTDATNNPKYKQLMTVTSTEDGLITIKTVKGAKGTESGLQANKFLTRSDKGAQAKGFAKVQGDYSAFQLYMETPDAPTGENIADVANESRTFLLYSGSEYVGVVDGAIAKSSTAPTEATEADYAWVEYNGGYKNVATGLFLDWDATNQAYTVATSPKAVSMNGTVLVISGVPTASVSLLVADAPIPFVGTVDAAEEDANEVILFARGSVAINHDLEPAIYSKSPEFVWKISKVATSESTYELRLLNADNEPLAIGGKFVTINNITWNEDKYALPADGIVTLSVDGGYVAFDGSDLKKVSSIGEATQFGLGELGETYVFANQLIDRYGDYFTLKVTYENEKGKEIDITGELKGQLRPVRSVSYTNGEATYVDEKTQEHFMLVNEEGNIIAINTKEPLHFGGKKYGFALTTITPKEWDDAQDNELLGKGYNPYLTDFRIAYTPNQTGDEVTNITDIKISGTVNEPDGAVYYDLLLGRQTDGEDATLVAAESQDLIEDGIIIKLNAGSLVDAKEWLTKPAYYTIEVINKTDDYVVDHNFTDNHFEKVLGLGEGGAVEWVDRENIDLTKPEGQFAITYNSTDDEYIVTNRENNRANTTFFNNGALYQIDATTFAFVTSAGTDTLAIKPVTDYKSEDGFRRYTAAELNANTYNIAMNLLDDSYLNVVENHTDKHRIGLDREEVTEWRIEMPTVMLLDNGDDKVRLIPDTVTVETPITYYVGAPVNDWVTTTATDYEDDYYAPNTALKIPTYILKNTDTNEYLYGKNYTESEGNAYYVCEESEVDATRVAFKLIGGSEDSTVNIVPVYRYVPVYEGNELVSYNRYNWGTNLTKEDEGAMKEDEYKVYASQLWIDGTKIIGGTTSKTGVLKDAELYEAIANDLFVINKATAPTYKKVDQGSNIILSRVKNNDEVIYEAGEFAGISNRVAYTDINPTLYVDSAYVDRAGNYAYQYLLMVQPNLSNEWYCPYNNEHNTEAWREENGVDHCADAVRTDRIDGRFLVNMVDSAEANKDVHNNKFAYNGETKLAFVDGFHQNDTLFFTNEAGDITSKVAVGNADFNFAKFTFKMIDETDNEFVIETGLGYNKKWNYAEDNNGNWHWIEASKEVTPGYLRWVNGNLVVTQNLDEAERFTMEDSELQATANETITAEGAVSVVATDGAVVIKGAEGKNVVIATILGKVVANETINSDNETIAVPAGIAVVSVDGESFKVVVK